MKKYLLIIVVLLLVVVGCGKKTENIEYTDDYIAVMAQPLSNGVAGGVTHMCYIYKSDDGYNYVEIESSFMSGKTEEKKVGSGTIKSKKELTKLNKEITSKSCMGNSCEPYYVYRVDDNNDNDYMTFDQLADRLFENG